MLSRVSDGDHVRRRQTRQAALFSAFDTSLVSAVFVCGAQPLKLAAIGRSKRQSLISGLSIFSTAIGLFPVLIFQTLDGALALRVSGGRGVAGRVMAQPPRHERQHPNDGRDFQNFDDDARSACADELRKEIE